jgi:hypothetical protein
MDREALGWPIRGLSLLLLVRVVAAEPADVALADGHVILDLASLPTLDRQAETDDQLKAHWLGKWPGSEVSVELRMFPMKEYEIQAPEEVAQFIAACYSDPKQKGDPDFDYAETEIAPGPYGWMPYASLCQGRLPSPTKNEGEVYVLGSVLETAAYALTLEARPPLDDATRDRVRAFLRKGIRARCRTMRPDWTDEEVAARWGGKPAKVIRTEHYLIMTNASAGNLFAKKMEECYSTIREVFPFTEVQGRRLMPVFLFRDENEYVEYCCNVAEMSTQEARATKGHAWKDYYATYYDSPNDPVHIHEATHQIFENRLFLSGGGSWFQEGVAEYMCTSRSARRTRARPLATKDTGPRLAALVRHEELPGNDYALAASIIEFLRESKDVRDRFPVFLRRVGGLRESTPAVVIQTLESVYGTDLKSIEAGWIKYWKR